MHLADLVELLTEKVETIYQVAKDGKTLMEEAADGLKETTELVQGLAGDLDAQITGIVTASAALVKLHKVQSKG